MKLEDIEKDWAEDCIVNQEDLGKAAMEIPKLHSKYYGYLLNEKRLLYILQEKKEELAIVLENYFLKTMTTEERLAAGLPDFLDKKILKSDVDRHIDRWPEIIQLNLKIAIQQDKIDFLKDINKMIHNRSFVVKDAISWILFTNGQN